MNRAFGDAIVQNFGASEDVLIRLAPRDGVKANEIGDQVLAALRSSGETVDMRRIEFVGPNVGEELTEQGGPGYVSRIAMYPGIRSHAL